MKLNDPFGRVGRRQNQAYTGVRRQLQARGIEDPAAVRKLVRAMSRSALVWSGITLLSSTFALVLFPAYRGIIGTVGALILAWIVASWFQAQMHLRRYINELGPDGPTNREGEQP